MGEVPLYWLHARVVAVVPVHICQRWRGKEPGSNVFTPAPESVHDADTGKVTFDES